MLEAATDFARCQENFFIRRGSMINKTKLAAISAIGAIAFVAAMGLASPTLAASTGPYGEQYNGGGSAGYNHNLATDYRLKHHKRHHMTSNTNK
jgi:hypothetical protein